MREAWRSTTSRRPPRSFAPGGSKGPGPFAGRGLRSIPWLPAPLWRKLRSASAALNGDRRKAMAVQRDNPYAGFSFLVDLGDGDPTGVSAGFSEVSGLGMTVSVIEYRNGNDKSNAPRKLPGLTKTPEVSLRRGV